MFGLFIMQRSLPLFNLVNNAIGYESIKWIEVDLFTLIIQSV